MSIFKDFQNYDDCEPIGAALPQISIDKKYYEELSLDPSTDNKELLRSLSRDGIKRLGIDKFPNKKQYYNQAKYELEVFEETGLVDYILALWDIVKFSNENNIKLGSGRGSAPASTILYLIGITKIDPIEKNLIFERFVSKTRVKKVGVVDCVTYFEGSLLADVDLDFDYARRGEIIKYIEEKYKGRTAKILTFNTFSSKLCIKESAKFFNGANEDEANVISDSIPKNHGIVASLSQSEEESEKFKNWSSKNSWVLKNAKKVEGLNKNTGQHPSGIAICSQNIEDVSPLQLTGEGKLITGYEMNDVADLMVKFDILGLRTISIANRACELAGVELDNINPNDGFIYKVFQEFNHPCGLFQISADTNFKVAREVKPDNLTELSDVIALGRPGSLAFLKDYVDQKRNYKPAGLNKELDEILARSKNVLLYQESTMEIIHKVFKFTLSEAEDVRKIIGKKLTDKMPEWKEKIFNSAKENNIPESVATWFWKAMDASSNYSFNLGHSAAYADLAAKTVFLKYKYPKEFFCSILETSEFDPDPMQIIADVSREAPDFGIKLLPPNLERSQIQFSIEGDDIRYGLSSIKGVSQNIKDALSEFSELKPTNKYEVFSCAKQCKINIGVLTSLIYAGALGTEHRSKKVLEAQAFNLLTDREKRNFALLGESSRYDLLKDIAETVEKERLGDDNKPLMKESRFETFKKKFEPHKKMFFENRKHENLSVWFFEKTLLGYSFSLNLKDCFKDNPDLRTLREINEDELEEWRAVVQVDDFFVRTSKEKGNKYMRMEVSDDTGKSNLLLSDSARESKLTDFQSNAKLSKGDIIIVRAKRSSDGSIHFVDNIKIVTDKVYTKTRQLK